MSDFQWMAAGLMASVLLWAVLTGCIALRPDDVSNTPKPASAPASAPVLPSALVRLNLDKHLGQRWVNSALAHFSSTQAQWQAHCTEPWFMSIHHYDLEFLLRYAFARHQDKSPASPSVGEEVRQVITVSGALFDFHVPPALWCLDADSIDMILRYRVLTDPVPVDLASYSVSAEVSSKRFALLVHTLMQSDWLSGVLASTKRADNFVILKAALINQANSPWPFLLAEGDQAFKKALSAVYLIGGFAVPRDYLYIDQEVKDYVLKTGRYAPFKQLHLHQVPLSSQ